MGQTKDVDRLQLAELLDFRRDLGVIRLHDQRVVILSAVAVGLIKKQLIDTFGRDVARRLMLRFGYADGKGRRLGWTRASGRCRPTRWPFS